MPFTINNRTFADYMDAVAYQNGWNSWPSWPIVDGEDAAVNTPEALGFFDRGVYEHEYERETDAGRG